MGIRVHRVKDFSGGWFVGDFNPCIFRSNDMEVGFKHFETGDTEPEHFQRKSTELTLVVRGKCRIGNQHLIAGDIAEILPLISASFEALSRVDLIVVKFPSSPKDKVLGEGDIALG